MNKSLFVLSVSAMVIAGLLTGWPQAAEHQHHEHGEDHVHQMNSDADAEPDKTSADDAHAAHQHDAEADASNAKDDPSDWGIAQGEAATRRHIEQGLKAGDIDPVTGLEILYYHDPMVPGRQFDAPGKSPFMDMMLVPMYADSGRDKGTVMISPRIQQNLGIRFATVQRGDMNTEITAVGSVAWNERKREVLQARANGFVEKLHVRAELDHVKKGEALFELYVPDWIAVQEDYLLLLRMNGDGLDALRAAAKQRMRQAGMNDEQITAVTTTKKVLSRVTVRAPISGVITALNVREGSTVMTGMPLLTINALSPVWIEAEVPESKAVQLKVGTTATIQHGGQTSTGPVKELLPQVNAMTRTQKARVEIDNRDHQFVPGMFVTVSMPGTTVRDALYVPSEAVIYTGKRQLVLVKTEEDAFRPVIVSTGIEQNGNTQIISGLREQQQIVRSGQFLIESEASLRGLLARLEPAETASDNAALSAPETYDTMAEIKAIHEDRLTLRHGEIPALGWPAMTMDFELSPKVDTTRLNSGDRIHLQFVLQDEGAPKIVTIHRLNTSESTP
ncbi:efflux RND transporter periplasmic adaptor subunit [Permianibacter aggregans]|uniref:Cu(I)/Ag(I) efflux system membrane fusion protein n=1 Tax=Permianibacter aggregans TaxID=1510150 RepID=A0A4R6UK63_9GAMM|nr:efflux RND transporter periplasmic adaptor subunit [Permianibacter aggregans]TDQ45713.1 Cu(I)/Ag(I) efflux system membrane fusion protein [Permianibacter aggregans]